MSQTEAVSQQVRNNMARAMLLDACLQLSDASAPITESVATEGDTPASPILPNAVPRIESVTPGEISEAEVDARFNQVLDLYEEECDKWLQSADSEAAALVSTAYCLSDPDRGLPLEANNPPSPGDQDTKKMSQLVARYTMSYAKDTASAPSIPEMVQKVRTVDSVLVAGLLLTAVHIGGDPKDFTAELDAATGGVLFENLSLPPLEIDSVSAGSKAATTAIAKDSNWKDRLTSFFSMRS